MIFSRRTEFLIAAIAVIVGAAATYMFFNASSMATDQNAAFYVEDGVAIGGTDPVAYFIDGAPVAGKEAFKTEWGGVEWRFASAENRDRFEAHPVAYAPQYGGYCAWAVAEKGQLYSTKPDNWAIVDGKLYLNFNDDVQSKWDKDREGFISRGDGRWPEIAPAAGS